MAGFPTFKLPLRVRSEGAKRWPLPTPRSTWPWQHRLALTTLLAPPPNHLTTSLLLQTVHHSQLSVLSTGLPFLPSVLTYALHLPAEFPPSHLGPLLFMDSPQGASATELLIFSSQFLQSIIQTLLCLQQCLMVSTTAFWELLIVS